MIGEEKVAAETATNKPGAQRRLIDFHSVSISIKSFALRSAVRLLDGMIWLLDLLITIRGDDDV